MEREDDLTAPAAGMGPVLAQDVRGQVESLPGWRGPKSRSSSIRSEPDMMTEAAKLQLGLM